jgi:hypothetical protein
MTKHERDSVPAIPEGKASPKRLIGIKTGGLIVLVALAEIDWIRAEGITCSFMSALIPIASQKNWRPL